MNKIRKGIRLPRENNALRKNVDSNSNNEPTVGKSPIKERPKGPIKSSDLFTELFLLTAFKNFLFFGLSL